MRTQAKPQRVGTSKRSVTRSALLAIAHTLELYHTYHQRLMQLLLTASEDSMQMGWLGSKRCFDSLYIQWLAKHNVRRLVAPQHPAMLQLLIRAPAQTK